MMQRIHWLEAKMTKASRTKPERIRRLLEALTGLKDEDSSSLRPQTMSLRTTMIFLPLVRYFAERKGKEKRSSMSWKGRIFRLITWILR